MTPFEVRDCLSSMTVIYDTREQETAALHRRLKSMQCPHKRQKLDSGDYSCECTLPNGIIYSLADKVVI